MSQFHFHVDSIGNAKNQSAVASAAYQAAEKIKDERDNKVKNFTNKHEVVFSKIQLPEHAPKEFLDRSTLWNSVQRKEKAATARLARKINAAIPIEMIDYTKENPYALAEKTITEYIQKTFVDDGMVADWSIHDKKDGNPHIHIMLTVRPFNKNGKWGSKKRSEFKLDANGNRIPKIDPETGKQKKVNGRWQWERRIYTLNWDKLGNYERWREAWAKAMNPELRKLEAPEIDHRSYKRQRESGKDVPEWATIHEGYYARKVEAQNPGSSWKIAKNNDIRHHNQLALMVKRWAEEIKEIERKIKALKERIKALFTPVEKTAQTAVERFNAKSEQLYPKQPKSLQEPDIEPVPDLEAEKRGELAEDPKTVPQAMEMGAKQLKKEVKPKAVTSGRKWRAVAQCADKWGVGRAQKLFKAGKYEEAYLAHLTFYMALEATGAYGGHRVAQIKRYEGMLTEANGKDLHRLYVQAFTKAKLIIRDYNRIPEKDFPKDLYQQKKRSRRK